MRLVAVNNRPRHGLLWEASHKIGRKELSDRLGVSVQILKSWVDLVRWPTKTPALAKKVKKVLGEDFSDVFPDCLRKHLGNWLDHEDEASPPCRFVRTDEDGGGYIAPMNRVDLDDDIVDQRVHFSVNWELEERIDALLSFIGKRIDPRYSTVIVHRFGLQKNKPLSLSEVGKIMGVSKERIRQMEEKFVREVQHSQRAAEMLRGFR